MTLNDTTNLKSRSPPRAVNGLNQSPRSSVDSPRTPNSPFLHSLSNRFRKSSNASNMSMGSDPPAKVPDPADRTETAQSAKRYLLSIIRNDWEWPPPQPHTVSGGENNTGEERKQDSVLAQREPLAWRTREEGASDLDLDLSPLGTGNRKSKRNSDPYRFENPDAIGEYVHEKRMKRRRTVEKEMAWNEGLRTWTDRRNAWTGAARHKPRESTGSEGIQSQPSSGTHGNHKNSLSSNESKHSYSSQVSATVPQNSHQDAPDWPLPVEDHSGEPIDQPELDFYEGPYIPIYPPLFSTSNILRSRIKPAAYPTIYSKVVLQSLTPNVPIPLTHMTGALVDGWKSEGNWPPQTLAEQQQAALLKRAKGKKKGETAFQKWRKEKEADKVREQEALENELADQFEEEPDEKKGFRKSISGAVKKVLGLHPEEEEDGGLAKLGLEFAQASDEDAGGLLRESARVAHDNVLLNQGLLGKG